MPSPVLSRELEQIVCWECLIVVRMANRLQSFLVAIALFPFLSPSQAADPVEKGETGSVLLNPSAITITGHFETSPGPTTLDLALRSLRQQLYEKQAAEAAKSPLEPLWKNSIWKYLPSDPVGTLNSPVGGLPDNLARTPLHLDDPFCTPAYLTLEVRQLDRELVVSEQRSLWFFGH
jgi:hypothetical protein